MPYRSSVVSAEPTFFPPAFKAELQGRRIRPDFAPLGTGRVHAAEGGRAARCPKRARWDADNT